MKLELRPKAERKFETISFRCTVEQANYLKGLADSLNTSVTDVIMQLIEQYRKQNSNDLD